MAKMPQTVTESAVQETRAICKALANVSVGLYGCNLDRLFIAHFQNILYHFVACVNVIPKLTTNKWVFVGDKVEFELVCRKLPCLDVCKTTT